jgi:hypothetical protein
MTTAATPTDNTSDAEKLPRPQSFYDVKGWFFNGDVVLFDWFLERQRRLDQHGDLLEMGAYMGKSAIMMRSYLRDDETFTVCDLFDSDAPDEHNQNEMHGSYSTLTRRAFEANYLSFHDELPRIIQAPTTVVPDQVEDGSCRFIHIDASHLYEHVWPDIAAARNALKEDGIVVLDDYRSEHTPGVSCATWQAVTEGDLKPICVSGQKFYGTWGDPKPVQDELYARLKERGDCWLQMQEVAGHKLLLAVGKKAKRPALPVSKHAKSGAAKVARQSAPTESKGAAPRASVPAPASSRARQLAKDLLPPLVTRAIVRSRKRR